MTSTQEVALRKRLEAEIGFELDPPRSTGCDGTHRLAREALDAMGLDVEKELASLVERGGRCCDCEILMNADLLAEESGKPEHAVVH